MAQPLTPEEIQKRLVRLQNLERLYADLKEKYHKLKEENEALKATRALQHKLIEQLKLRIEELERMVFGRRKPKPPADREQESAPHERERYALNRPASSSYQRPKPKEDEIASVERHPCSTCPDCGSPLIKVNIVERYVEDILPLSEWWKVLKRITKHFITTGYCKRCKGRKSAVPIPPHTVTIGAHTKQHVSFSTVVLGLSYEQIRQFLARIVHSSLSDGEVANMLMGQANILRPAFERLKESIRQQQGAHYDETSWSVQDEIQGNHAWVMTGTETPDAVFLLGRSRGKGNAEELKGDGDHVGITEDYGAYKNLFTHHQLSWSHPHRKLRDLKDSNTLPKDACSRPFVLDERVTQKQELMKRFDGLCVPHSLDPKKLHAIKQRLRERRERYFTCFTVPGIPLGNNKAERSLRHLVIKRKSSFGSWTQKGADVMSVLYSVLLSLWWKSKPSFFQNYAAVLNTS